MKFNNPLKVFHLFLLGVFIISFVSAQELNNPYSYNLLPDTIIDNSVVSNVSNVWNTTSLGLLTDANATQFVGTGGVLSILESWLISFGGGFWCQLTGCTMTGNLDVNANVTANRYNTNLNTSTGVCTNSTGDTFFGYIEPHC